MGQSNRSRYTTERTAAKKAAAAKATAVAAITPSGKATTKPQQVAA